MFSLVFTRGENRHQRFFKVQPVTCLHIAVVPAAERRSIMYGYNYIQQIVTWKLNEEQEPERRHQPAPREVGGEAGDDAVYYVKNVIQHRLFLFLAAFFFYPANELFHVVAGGIDVRVHQLELEACV